MMETVLNVGLATSTIPGLIAKTGNERFVYDAYRRLIMMYSDVVMEKAEGIEPEEGKAIRKQLDEMLDRLKESKGYASDTDLTVEDLKQLCEAFKRKVQGDARQMEFPDDPMQQLRGGICAVLKSWNGKKAVSYRRIEGDSGRMGHRGQCAEHGVRQHGRHFRHRRCLHAQPGHRRKQVLRRVARQCAGRGRRRPAPAPRIR